MNIKGTVEKIRFRNESNGYTVLLVNSGKTVFTIVGNFGHISEGETIDAKVTETYSETYGDQYKLISYEVIIPDNDIEALKKFLASLKVKGIGEATSSRIVDTYGDKAIETIKNDKEKLLTIKGMNLVKLDALREKVIEKESEIKVLSALEKYKLGPKTIRKIIDEYGDKVLDVIKENPYDLALKIDGIGFVICDNIAKESGIDKDNEKRVAAGIVYVLEQNYIDGNVFYLKNELEKEVKKLLGLCEDYKIDDLYDDLEINSKIKRVDYNDVTYIFPKFAYSIEKRLSELLYEKKNDITIITGGPGTGKTYNIKKYLKDAESNGDKVLLCAPTGRAAKRMTEVTDHDAQTIHRLLGAEGDKKSGKTYFSYNEDNKLDADLIIVDEMSMVDESLMLSLIKAVPDYTRLVFVGDVDQLPSVGAGNVLKDMINSGYFSVMKLTTIHRQAEGSTIVKNAHLVNEGKDVDFSDDEEDFKFVHRTSDDKIKESIKILVKENIPKHFDIDIDKIQVLCPSKKASCGVDSLNEILQDAINPESYDKTELNIGLSVFRLGDKVMQTVNNYDIPYDLLSSDGGFIGNGSGIFNGDIGKITYIDEDEKTMEVTFDDRLAYYSKNDIEDLSLAYAITVHKSQGSEYDVVVMPMSYAPYQLQNRKILYTAMTRAKKCIIFVGNEKYFYDMIKNENEVNRNTALLKKIYIS